MLTLELTIQRKTDEGWPLIAEQIRPGLLPTRSEGMLALDQNGLLAALTPRAYGKLLGEALFHGPIRDTFVRALAESEDDIRVLLFVEADELRVLRWERLCAPFAGRQENNWDFLVLNQRTLFSLYLPSLTDRRYPPIGRRDLRALVLIACPTGLDQYGLIDFDAPATATQVEEALGDIPVDLLMSSGPDAAAGAIGPASLDALCQQLTVQQYTLVHVVCHGHYDHKSGETSLFLADKDHGLDRVTATRLLEQLGRLRGRRGLPHFAFLATCDSAKPEAEGALGGLAQRLVRDLGMPAVIAMTETVSIATAQLLTSSFYTQLETHGEVDRALVEATIAVAEHSDVTVPAIYSRLGGQPLFSHTLDRELTTAEISDGLERTAALLAERAPVLEEEFRRAAETLRQSLSGGETPQSDEQQLARRGALLEVEQIADKALDLSFKALCLGQEPAAYDARCPFRGLVAFGIEDHPFFFGRDRLIEQLGQKLMAHPFLGILGPSGSGKSSLVLAGLIPVLQKKMPTLTVYVITPGSDPLAALTVAEEQSGLREDEIVQPTLLVVDQFEESFTLCTDEATRRRFFQQLLTLVERAQTMPRTNDEQPPLLIVLTMRADFWGECASYPHLRDQLLAHQTLIGPMTGGELRSAMEQQAATVGLRFEADLANTILDDVAGEPGAMPLLQHGLRELWQRRYGRWLPAAEYREMEGIKRAIAGTAEAIYQQLSPADQERMRALLLRLTRLDEEALPGETRRDTRRRVAVDELITTASERSHVLALIQQLADARLLVTSRNAQSDQDEVEVAHEALIREWPRLQEWIAADLEGLRMQRQVADAIVQWQANGEDPSFLYRGRRLRAVQDWVVESPGFLNAQEQAFVAASSQRERLGTVRRWGLRVALVLVPLVVALGVMWIGGVGPFADPDIEWIPEEVVGGIRNIVWDAEGEMFVGLDFSEDALLYSRRDGDERWQPLVIQDEGQIVEGIETLTADPYKPGLIYVIADDLTLWRTQDAGRQWIKLSPPIIEVGDIAVSNQQVVYISGTNEDLTESTLYVSTDQGLFWQQMEQAVNTYIWFITWVDDRLLVARDDGLWQWKEQAGWSLLYEPEEGYIEGAIALDHGIWIATTRGVYYVTDDNAVSLVVSESFSKLARVDIDPPVVIGVTNTDLRLFKSSNADPLTIGIREEWNDAQQVRIVRTNSKWSDLIWVGTDTGLFSGDPSEYIK